MRFRATTAVLCREARSLSQGKAAKLLGMSQSKLSKIEQEWTDPKDEEIDRMAEVYGQPRRLFFMQIPESRPIMCVCCEPYAPPGGYR